MDLKSFSNTEPYSEYRDPSVLKEKAEEKKVDKESVKKTIEHFSKMPQDELMTEFVKQVALQKQRGNIENMLQTVERIRPLLNEEQQKKLNSILEQVEL